MRLADKASIAWLDGSSASVLQATKDLNVPNADGLMVLKVPALKQYGHVHFAPLQHLKCAGTILRHMNTVVEAMMPALPFLMLRQTDRSKPCV